MTDGVRRRAAQRSPAAIELRVAARLENLALLRTMVVAVGTFSDLSLDAVSDLRLAVDEACTALIGSATAEAMLEVVVDPRKTWWWSRRGPLATPATRSSPREVSAGMCSAH